MQYGEEKDLAFEIKNNGLFPFKYAICDFNDEEAKNTIKEEREKEIQERRDEALGVGSEEAKDPKAKKVDPKAKPGKEAKGGAAAEGEELQVSQYTIRPKTGVIEPENSASIKIHFKAEGAQFYEKALAIDISGRDFQDQPEGIKFDVSAESCIPGINAEDLDSVFEEQTVVPSLDSSANITSPLYAIQERVFWFGTLVASKVPEGVIEKFKIMNPNKIPCTVNFSVKPRSQSKNEGFAFEVSPGSVKIPPHENAYVKVSFKPENMMPYGGIFEAIVDNGDPESSSGKFNFELRGEGTLPTLLLTKPTELSEEGLPLLKLKKTRIGKRTTGTITLHNEGAVPATVKFKPITNENLEFKGEMSRTLEPKEYYSCDIEFVPTKPEPIKYQMEFETLHNPYECHKVIIQAEGYQETVTFENLPEEQEDKLEFGDAIVKKTKSINFDILNTSDKPIRFEWSIAEPGFTFLPSVGYLRPRSSKPIKVKFLSEESVEVKDAEITCDTKTITQDTSEFVDWDDSMTEIKMIRPSELKKILAIKEAKERKKKEEAEAVAAAAAKKGKKPPPKKEDERLPEEDIEIDETEDATEEYAEALPEPHFEVVEGTEKQSLLKANVVCDYTKFECTTDKIIFKPTLMFQTRSYKFTIRNTSTIALDYSFHIINANTGIPDSGAFSISPRKGTIPAGTDEILIVKFSPQEIDRDFARVLSCRIANLDPEIDPLTIKLDGVAERPVCHFELPPSTYRDKKGKDMTPIDSKYSIIEFQSLGTKVKNTNRFMVANPTSHRYDFEWEEVEEHDTGKAEVKKEKPMFRCMTPKGTILSGKKFKMAFEYIPDNVGEHQSYWNFKIPSEGIVQPFMVVGSVVEPIVLFETGKINFGPLLLGGKNRETINLVNQEHLPFSFHFNKDSIKENPDYGDSLQVTPVSGTVPPQSQLPVEVVFKPKYETDYNYNLICNVKRKERPLVLNVKGVGYAIHYSVLADKAGIPVLPTESHSFEFGDFFVNEKKTKSIVVENKGDFNFDFQFKRQPNKYITIEPETGTVKKGDSVNVDIVYLPVNSHKLKNYKCVLKIASGPKFNFLLNGTARKPGIEMSFHQYDFGPCFVTRQPMSIKAVLELVNNDDSAISIETNFEKKPYLDVQLSPGEVLLPSTKDKQEKLSIPIIFTPRAIQKYYEVVTFDFNGIYKIDVVIKGEGIPMNIELVDPDQHIVDFGILAKGSDVTKTVNLINKSRKAIQFTLTAAHPEDLIKNAISISPSEEVSLKPKKVLPIEVRFNPKTRMPNFSHDIMLDIKGNESRKLFTVQGVSHGIELKLMEEVVGFGSVIKGSRLTKQLQLANFGDIRAKFKWDSKAYAKNFTIFPESGYIPPHEDIYLEITFHPNKVDNDICVKNIKCEYTGGSSLGLTLMGKCVAPDKEATKEINFETIVRKATTQDVSINNPTEKEWRIKPTIATNVDSIKDYFKGNDTLVVPPKGNANYQVTYCPLTMTKEKEVSKEGEEEKEKEVITIFHEASLFFPLPDGSAESYKLFGKSLKPEASNKFEEKVEAKKAKYINIPVENWLKTPQRFKVTTKVEGESSETTFIRGANTFDVQANSTKDYKLNFLSYKA